ncbi:hypothetical protein CDAR_616961 [Caerostris darwini]|uniref:Endonuclease/exonuclease/phosphatase domain-containing protein n=1 Tax=Caerostris darwini TaxID=1538125 RepID=A0AAV4NTF5_9ARAC|nr:hypothetical protein CDAR_616961 [Caerostris darwini]
MAQLQESIRNLDLDYISLNEPYCFKNQITCIPLNYTIAASSESPKGAIIIKSTLNAQIIICHKEVVIIQARLNNQDTILVSAYCPPNKNMDATLLIIRNAISKFSNLPIVILGDFNAKSRVWGQRDLDERGSKVLTFCHQHDLAIENSPESPPTYSSSRGDSWIDLLLTRNLASEITLEVTDHISNSDHNLLIVRHLYRDSHCTNTRKLSINKHNWIKIKTTLHHILKDQADTDLLPANVINSNIQHLQDTIFTAISKLKDNTNSSNSKPQKKKHAIWWTRELEIKRSKTRALGDSSRKKQILASEPIKKKSLKKTCQTGNLSTSIDESHRNILDFHFPWSNENHCSNLPVGSSQLHNFTPLTCAEVAAVISNIKPNKATGLDGLPGNLSEKFSMPIETGSYNYLTPYLRKATSRPPGKPPVWSLLRKKGRHMIILPTFGRFAFCPPGVKYLTKLLRKGSPSTLSLPTS